MDADVRDADITGFEELIAPCDPRSRRPPRRAVVRAGTDLVITANVKDLPHSALHRPSLLVEHPFIFLADLFGRLLVPLLQTLLRVRARMRNLPVSHSEHIAVLPRIGLSTAVQATLKHTATL